MQIYYGAGMLGLAALLIAGSPGAASTLKSPDGQVQVSVEVRDFGPERGCPTYAVTYRGRPVLAPSRLGLELEGASLRSGFRITRQAESRRDETWRPVYGERSQYRDHYRQLRVDLREEAAPHRTLSLTFRAYDEGVAFCYEVPGPEAVGSVTLQRETTEFRFTADHPAWASYSAQGPFTKAPLSQLRPGCERPLTIELGDHRYAALAEARLVDYARTKFGPLAGEPLGLTTELGSPVRLSGPLRSPWRVVMFGESPGQLLERDYLLLNLNDPCALADTSWIRPGKAIRETTLSTRGAKAAVDFAARRGIQYLEFDAGWYGPERTGDPRRVSVNPNRPQGDLDLQEVIRYASSRGIGILLYVNQLVMEQHLDEILPLYERWGVKGVKYGFVKVGPQEWTAWLHEAVRKAARYHLMVDIHDEYRPTGYSRTYPNLLTQEGVRGDEESPANEVSLTSLFTRYLAGAADHTICYFDRRVDQNATHAFQLAKAVCCYSPFQFLYWYDHPPLTGTAPAGDKVLSDEPELEFFDQIPTVWDDTRVLEGEIGRYALLARRSGPEWYLGLMNSGEARTFSTTLDFLEPGKRYVAYRYSDDPQVSTRTRVRIERLRVDRKTVLQLGAGAQGGAAVRIVPAGRE